MMIAKVNRIGKKSQKQKLSKNRDKYITVLFVLIASALVYPFFFLNPSTSFKVIQMFFSMQSLAFICLGFIFLYYNQIFNDFIKNNKIFFLSFCYLFVLSIVQYFLSKTNTLSELGFSLLWITIPIFAYLFATEIKRILPWYFFIFLLFDLFVSSLGLTPQVVGIAGNVNWHATFLVILNIFSIYFAFKCYKSFANALGKGLGTLILIVIFGLCAAYSLYIIVLCKCKATWIGIFIALILFLYFESFCRSKRLFYTLTISVLVVIIIVFSGEYVLNKKNYNSGLLYSLQVKNISIENKIADNLNNDVRGPLWLGCIDMMKAYPFFGVGTARFEDVYSEYRPISYFMKPDNAVRSNYPHNSELYAGCCFGIIGLIAWLILYAFPLLLGFCFYYRLKNISKIFLYSYLILFIHSQLDLIFFEWPTLLFSVIILGVLLRDVSLTYLRKKEDANASGVKAVSDKNKINVQLNNSRYGVVKYLFIILSIICFIIAIRIIYLDTMSTYYFREGELDNIAGSTDKAFSNYSEGLEYNKSPEYIFRCGVNSLLKYNDPILALHYFMMFKEISLHNYAHSNGFTAVCLIELGKEKEALPYLLKEAVMYPLLVGSWYKIYYLESKLGMKKEAQEAYQHMIEAIKYKDLPVSAIPYIAGNPNYDAYPWRIPDNIRAMLMQGINPNNTQSR